MFVPSIRRLLMPSMRLTRGLASWSNNVSETIGKTPMVRLNRVIGKDCKAANVLVKLEMQNPGGSVKDRIALSMIEEAEKRGDIHPSRTTIVEATSGNTGIGLAMVAAAKGYKLIIAMPQVPPMFERYILARKFGAEVHLISVTQDNMKGTIERMINYPMTLVASDPDKYWCPQQFHSDDNPLAHYDRTGPEIWEQTDGQVDCFIAGAGTGGTLSGVGQYLKQKKPDCHVICVEPTESRGMMGENTNLHGLTGMSGMPLCLLERLQPDYAFDGGQCGPVDEFLSCNTPDCIAMANRCAAEEGLLVAPSSGAVINVAVEVASRPEMAGKNIVVLQASSAIRYIKHPMWEQERVEADAALPVPPDLDTELPVVRWMSEDYVPPAK